MAFKAFILLLSLSAAAVSAFSNVHVARTNHHAIAARVAAPVPAPVALGSAPPRKRIVNKRGKRCKPRPTSSSSVSASASASTSASVALSSSVSSSSSIQTPQTTPSPSSTSKPADPTPTPAPAPTPTPAPPSASKPPASGPSYLFGTQTGDGTVYTTGKGACGIVNKPTDYIAAASHYLFDTYPGYVLGNPNTNPLCGKKVRASHGGRTIVVTITDRCEACSITDLDFSPSAFSDLFGFPSGRVPGMTWVWI